MDERIAAMLTVLPQWIAGVFGLLFGSFLNVCIYRSQHDLSIVNPPRSFCPMCKQTIAWYDNVPVVSYLLLRGRCRHCRSHIPARYLVVEVITALLFFVIAGKYGVTIASLKWCMFASLLIVLFWTDMEGRLLPDEFTLGGVLLGLAFAAFVPPPGELLNGLIAASMPRVEWLFEAAAAALILTVPLLLLGWLYEKVRGRSGLGLGDIKLLAMIGAFLGVEAGLAALLIGSLAGSIAGLVYIRVRRLDAHSYWLPFGSFLCIGALISMFRTGWGALVLGVR